MILLQPLPNLHTERAIEPLSDGFGIRFTAS